MSKTGSADCTKSAQAIHTLPNLDYRSFVLKNEIEQKETSPLPENTWKIQTFTLAKENHVLLHLLVNTNSDECLTACVSETFSLRPSNPHSAQALFQIKRLGDIKLQKRIFQVFFDAETVKKKYFGILILAQVMVPFNVTEKPNRKQINEALKTLKAKSRSLTAILKACECQVKRLTKKEQLGYIKEKKVSIDDIIIFKNVEELISLLPNVSSFTTRSIEAATRPIHISKNSKTSANFFHHFFQPASEELPHANPKKLICKETN